MICKLFWFCIIVMFSIISSDDFCQQFRHNYDRIGFTFKRHFKSGLTEDHIIINGKCWTLDFQNSIDLAKIHLNFKDLQSKSCPIFSEEYNLALVLHSYYSNNYLFNKDTKRGVHIVLNDKHEGNKEMDKYEVEANMKFSGLNGQQFVSVYQPRDYSFKTKNKLVFIRVKDRKLEGRLYNYYWSTTAIEFVEEDHNRLSQDFPVLSGNQSIGNEEVMAIIYEHNPFGYLLLLKNGLNISWCWTSIKAYNCTPKLIVDCSGFPAREEVGNVWLLVSLILIGIVVLIMIIVISIFIIKNRNTGEQEAISKASATQTSRLSVKTGQPSTQSTARTFSQEFSLKKG